MSAPVDPFDLDPMIHTSVIIGRGSSHELTHLFTREAINAIKVAVAAQRPLLLRGLPGVGKSQLARAAAQILGRAFVSKTVHARTEPEDLLWSFDAVERLAEAQIVGVSNSRAARNAREKLEESRFITPEALWWTFDRSSARERLSIRRHGRVVPETRSLVGEPPIDPGCSAARGSVLLIDEIDKCDSSVPNSLLEALGHREFTCPAVGKIRMSSTVPPPLIVITTNEERVLPDAFLRRCFVLQLSLPEDPNELRSLLSDRARAHFPNQTFEGVLAEAARVLIDDRKTIRDERGKCPPGQAEYLDLIRALVTIAPGDQERQLKLLKEVSSFAFRKHPDGGRA